MPTGTWTVGSADTSGTPVGKGVKKSSSSGGSSSSSSAPQLPQLPDLSDLFGGNLQTPNLVSSGTPTPTAGGGAYLPSSVSYAPAPFTSNVQQNPQLQEVYNQQKAYQQQLAGNTDQDAILAMQRLRDVQSGQSAELAQNAAARGISPDSGVSQYLQSQAAAQGQRNQAGLSANLASGGRNLQLAALGQQGGTAGAMAGNLLGQQQYALNQWQAQQQAAQAQANLQLAAQNQGYNQMYGMANLQMQALQPLLRMYTGY